MVLWKSMKKVSAVEPFDHLINLTLPGLKKEEKMQ